MIKTRKQNIAHPRPYLGKGMFLVGILRQHLLIFENFRCVTIENENLWVNQSACHEG